MNNQLYISVYDTTTALDVLNTHTDIDGVIVRQSLLSLEETLTFWQQELIPLAKEKAIKLYLKDNRLLHNEHLKKVTELLVTLKDTMIGLFIGDPAAMMIAKEIGYQGEVVFSPEMILTSSGNSQFWVNQGANSVEYAHELTFKEINAMIEKQTFVPFVQIHGKLSMFQSRRLLVDNYFTHLEKNTLSESNLGELSLYDKEREQHYIITQDERGTEIYNGQIISVIDMLDRFETRPNCIVDTYFLTKEKRDQIIALYIAALSDTGYADNKQTYANQMQTIYKDEQLSRGFFLRPTIF